MNLKTAKSPKDITLAGISVEFDKRDGTVQAVKLRDGTAGGLLVVQVVNYSLEILVPTSPKLIGRWRLKATVGDVVIDETFTHEFEATGRRTELDLTDTNSTIEKVIVEE